MSIQIKIENIFDNCMYYYDNEWQKPVITEYQVFKLFYEQKNIPVDYFAFPWATMIDNNNRNNKKLFYFLKSYKINSSKCFTVMQHIYFYKYLDIAKQIGITHIFTPHKQINYQELEKKFNIKIIAFSLYPAQSIEKFNLNTISIIDRKFLTSFIGQYDPKCYISKIRMKIFDLFNNYQNCKIKRRNEWHYDCIVYEGKSDTNQNNEKEYSDNLVESKFSLCPSGSGPNSIRIWESMSYGSIPIILADSLVLPEIKDIIWNDYFIIWNEAEIDKLYEYLTNISENTLLKLSNNCIQLYNEYFSPNKMNRIILEYFE